jgi:hypothetical protein
MEFRIREVEPQDKAWIKEFLGKHGIPVRDEIELEMELNFEENRKEIKT